jgi:hypothetical protein
MEAGMSIGRKSRRSQKPSQGIASSQSLRRDKKVWSGLVYEGISRI